VEALKELRRRRGLSQKDLARESGVGQDTISGIESGRHEARPSTLRKLAEALDVEVEDFFREAAAPKGEAPGSLEEYLGALLTNEQRKQIIELYQKVHDAMLDESEPVAEDVANVRRFAQELGLSPDDIRDIILGHHAALVRRMTRDMETA